MWDTLDVCIYGLRAELRMKDCLSLLPNSCHALMEETCDVYPH